MLKIKGLKKKKKGKKGKHKEEDLFDPEELAQLEQYKREHQQKVEAGEVTDGAGEGSSTSEQSEEWKKFQALTAGVDDILKKTQGDLDRIKTTSYFQRKPPGPSTTESNQEAEANKSGSKPTKWTRFEDGSIAVDEEPAKEEDHTAEAGKVEEEQPPPVEEEEEEESDQDEDIFDTSYVDVVASGDVKLAYIPDSPTEEDTGPDPFDTSIVDKVIKVDPKKKKLVSLGCAVEVLTGKVDKPIPVAEALPTKRKRPKKQDLLLDNFDELETSAEATITHEPPKSILDEEPEFVPEEIDLSINLATVLPSPCALVERKDSFAPNQADNKSIVNEFDAVAQTCINAKTDEPDDDLDDEFAALAQESVSKEVIKPQIVSSNNNFEESINEDEGGDDPFDTTFAANVLPGKFELKIIEEEILLKEHDFPKNIISLPTFLEDIPSVRINDITNEHNFLEEDQAPLSLKHRDLLGGSTTDLTKISDSPIEPVVPTEQDDDKELTYSDPFDTSVVDILVAPGKTELKFLEQELLESIVSHIEGDDDFDPRADSSPKPSKPPVRPDQLPVGEKRLSIPKVVAFNIAKLQVEADLLAVDQEENSKVTKPLTPYYANPDEINSRPSCESETNLADPFDTSFVSHAPGKAELKLIESELATENNLKRDLSDPDFDPRGSRTNTLNSSDHPTNPLPPASLSIKPIHQSPDKLQPDILSEDHLITGKLHTPVVPKKIEEELDKFGYSDPFDTSIVKDVLPGKAELKLLESELIHADSGTSIKRSYTDPEFNPRDSPENQQIPSEEKSNYIDQPENISVTEKPLTPQSATSKISFDLGGDIDPFDTSCVENLVPGKTELKLLESELFN